MSLIHQEFYFIRHGQTDWNLKHIVMGSQNIALNQVGVKEAHKAEKLMQGYEYNTIISSPLDRALQTAEILNTRNITREIKIIDELKEACFGEIEGKSQQNSDWIQRWKSGHFIKGAEVYVDFKKRVAKGLQKAMTYPGPVLIVSHGVVYFAIQEIINIFFHALPNATPVYHRPPADGENAQWFVCHLGDEGYYE